MDNITPLLPQITVILQAAILIGVPILLWQCGELLIRSTILDENDPEWAYDGQEELYSEDPRWVADSKMQDDVLDALCADEITQEEAGELWSRHDY